MAAKKLSRLESNKEIRRALVRSGADMEQIYYSCHGRSVSLSGKLCRSTGGEMSTSNVEMLLQDMNRLGLQIHSELENWHISEGSISKKRASSEQNKQEKKNPAPKAQAKEKSA